MITRKEIQSIEPLIRPYIRRTPVLEVDGADFGLDSITLVFKLELFQHSGSFKARGAFTNLLTREIPKAGVVAASGGNHGVAIAYAAMKLNRPAAIFVPTVAAPAKIDRIRRYGAELVIAGDRYADALEASQEWIQRTGALPIHAYEEKETLRGQGTVALELEEQSPRLDSLLVAVGGGGLIGGIAAWYETRTRIISVEPELSPTLQLALAAGRPVDAPADGIAADSLAPRRVGQIMFPIAQKYVTEALLVTDEDIVESQKKLWETLRIVPEPGGAAAFAALLSGRFKANSGDRVGVVICGGNTDINFS